MNPSRWRLTRIAVAFGVMFVWDAARREFDYQIVLQLGLLLFFYVVIFRLLRASQAQQQRGGNPAGLRSVGTALRDDDARRESSPNS